MSAAEVALTILAVVVLGCLFASVAWLARETMEEVEDGE